MDWKLIWQIFWLFTKVAMFSWGGGPASLGLMQREVVAAGWVTPGPTAPQTSAFVGYKMAGWPGALSAVAGTVVPATLLMLILIIGFFSIKDNIYMKAAIKGMRPFVVGLLAWTAYQMAVTVFNLKQGVGVSLLQGWDKWLIGLGAFLILTFTNISPVWLVLATAAIGLIFYR
jgi:chromate transporter